MSRKTGKGSDNLAVAERLADYKGESVTPIVNQGTGDSPDLETHRTVPFHSDMNYTDDIGASVDNISLKDHLQAKEITKVC